MYQSLDLDTFRQHQKALGIWCTVSLWTSSWKLHNTHGKVSSVSDSSHCLSGLALLCWPCYFLFYIHSQEDHGEAGLSQIRCTIDIRTYDVFS